MHIHENTRLKESFLGNFERYNCPLRSQHMFFRMLNFSLSAFYFILFLRFKDLSVCACHMYHVPIEAKRGTVELQFQAAVTRSIWVLEAHTLELWKRNKLNYYSSLVILP